jgi:ribonuclease J
MDRKRLRIIPLGGLGEIGKNMMLFEYGEDLIAVDAGLMFPEEDMLGVDLVIPDISYILEHPHGLKAFFITHGHEDHTGALPYILRRVKAPIYCTPLTADLIEVKLKEARLLDQADLRRVQPGDRIQVGSFEVEPFGVAHSVPDSVGLAIRTPVGTVVHTGDFKLDHTPVMGQPTDLARLAQLGSEGVLLLLSDSTYVEIAGYTPSEQVVGASLLNILASSPGRVIVATFASLISRVQQVIDAAHATDRRVFITGRGMLDNVNMAVKKGYLTVPNGILAGVGELRRIPYDQIAVISTGSQGEPTSALTRMANRDHPHIKIVPGDTIVLSATAIPGNEALVYRTVDNLFRLGARVLYNRIADVHVRGHAAQEELKIVFTLVQPQYFVPVHGEYRHLVLHANLAQSLGVPEENTFVMVDGDVLEIGETGAHLGDRVSADYVYVDGLGVGDVDHVVLRDRQHLATDGMIVVVIAVDKRSGRVVGKPDVVSRGFVDVEESEELLERTRDMVVGALHGANHIAEWGVIHSTVKEVVARFLYEETRRRPMVLPVAVEV